MGNRHPRHSNCAGNVNRKPYGWQVCEEWLLELWPQPYHQRPQVEGEAVGVTTRGVCPHAPVNHTVFFLCPGFIKFMYINKILMKTRLQFFYITYYNVNYFVSQSVGLDFTSESGFCQWIWILPVGLDMKTPWARLPAILCDLHTTMA